MATSNSILLGAIIIGACIFAGLAVGPLLHHQQIQRTAEQQRECDFAIFELSNEDWTNRPDEFGNAYKTAYDVCGYEVFMERTGAE